MIKKGGKCHLGGGGGGDENRIKIVEIKCHLFHPVLTHFPHHQTFPHVNFHLLITPQHIFHPIHFHTNKHFFSPLFWVGGAWCKSLVLAYRFQTYQVQTTYPKCIMYYTPDWQHVRGAPEGAYPPLAFAALTESPGAAAFRGGITPPLCLAEAAAAVGGSPPPCFRCRQCSLQLKLMLWSLVARLN